MADQKISELVNILGENVEDSDEFVISDTSAGDNKALTWGEMRDEFYTPDNLVGTVSESGGVPTGAVIESGSNTNGEYVRFADGTQICWTVFNSSSNNPSVWTFPAVFSGTPSVQGTATEDIPRMVTAHNASPTSVEFWVYNPAGATSTTIHTRQAIGRWY